MKKLIVGLGNPGDKYRDTKHNVGFILLDVLAEKKGLTWKENEKLKSMLAVGDDIILVKPLTYMNLSGEAVRAASLYFKVYPENVFVVHDDVDLEPGAVKVQFDAGSAGHHGVENIIDMLGTREFTRMRIGVGRPAEAKFDVHDYVLSKMSSEELDNVAGLVEDLEKSISS